MFVAARVKFANSEEEVVVVEPKSSVKKKTGAGDEVRKESV